MTYFAGLDVSLEETAICVVDETGRIVKEMRAIENEVRAILREGGIKLGTPARAAFAGGCARWRATIP